MLGNYFDSENFTENLNQSKPLSPESLSELNKYFALVIGCIIVAAICAAIAGMIASPLVTGILVGLIAISLIAIIYIVSKSFQIRDVQDSENRATPSFEDTVNSWAVKLLVFAVIAIAACVLAMLAPHAFVIGFALTIAIASLIVAFYCVHRINQAHSEYKQFKENISTPNYDPNEINLDTFSSSKLFNNINNNSETEKANQSENLKFSEMTNNN